MNKVGLKGPTEKAILSAMKEWEEKTCIKFKPRTTEKDYIEFIDDGYGKCVTTVFHLQHFYFIIICSLFLKFDIPTSFSSITIDTNNCKSVGKLKFLRANIARGIFPRR